MLNLNWPMVRRFHEVAIRHQEAANVLLSECALNAKSGLATEVIYLGGYAAECMLKALLLSRFRPRKHLAIEQSFINELRHDINRLRKKLASLKKKPVLMPNSVEKALLRIGTLWHPVLRYDAKLTFTKDADDFMQMVNQVVAWAHKGV